MQHPPAPLSDRNAGSRRSSEQLSAADDTLQLNGADAHLNGSDQPAASEPSAAVRLMSRTDKDIIRLIGQHLQAIGLTYGLLTNEYLWGALQSKTRQLRLWLVAQRDWSWSSQPVLDLQRGPVVR